MPAALISNEPWDSFRNGDRENQDFWTHLRDLCKTVVWRRASGKVSEDDVFADVAVAVLGKSSEELARVKNPWGFCYMIANNCLLATLRVEGKHWKHTVSSVNDEGEDLIGLDTDAAVAVSEKEAAAEELADLLQRAGLNEEEYAVTMRKLEGYSQEEIANMMGVSPSWVSQIWSKKVAPKIRQVESAQTPRAKKVEHAKKLEKAILEDNIAIPGPPDDAS